MMQKTPFFLCATLLYPPLAEVVLGQPLDRLAPKPARVPGWRLRGGEGRPIRLAEAEASIDGLVIDAAALPDLGARLAHYAGFAGLEMQEVLAGAAGAVLALLPAIGTEAPVQDWNLPLWQARHGALATATAVDAMALLGQAAPVALNRRRVMMEVRADSRLRARASQTPETVRRAARAGDIVIDHFHRPYANFFAVEEFDLRFRRFDGTFSPQINRAIFISGDAVTVLPYDPLRDRLLVVEQFRAGPFARGDRNPWALEAIAGRIDPGERPEDCARREAIEEAGLTLDRLEFVAGHYPSPAAKTEYLYSYVALTDLPDGAAGVFGVAGEAEDIKGHLLPFEQAMQMVASGEIENGPLLVTLLWLARERARLRAEAETGPGA